MTANDTRRLPGTKLLKVGRVLFSDEYLSAAVLPTIADLQREIEDAGGSRLKRLGARWRGYRAFWALVVVAPFVGTLPPARETGSIAVPDVIARLAVGSIAAVIAAIIGPILGGWFALATLGGALVAMAIHAWYDRHPVSLPAPKDPEWRTPQINFSSTDVAGNIGGLIFVVGSLVIVVLGVPGLVWFLFAGLVAGSLLGWALLEWHAAHPKHGLPEDLISLR
jgi:hypothetical protein